MQSIQESLELLKKLTETCPEGLDVELLSNLIAESTIEIDSVTRGRASVIILEGLDGTGKSTTAQYLAEELAADLLRTPPDRLSQLRPFFDSQECLVRRAFYQLGNLLAARDIVLSPNRFVVCDRFWPSTFAYSEATAKSDESSPCLWPTDLPEPYRWQIVLLTLAENERQARIKKRNQALTVEDTHLKDVDFRDAVMRHYFRIPYVAQIDATPSTALVVRQILQLVDHG